MKPKYTLIELQESKSLNMRSKNRIVFESMDDCNGFLEAIFSGIENGKTFRVIKESIGFHSCIDVGITQQELIRYKEMESNSEKYKKIKDIFLKKNNLTHL